MEIDASRLKELVERPAESLSVEIKTWIDPNEPEGCAKIVLAALALRNYGGGYLLIGFDNKSLQPDKSNAPADPKGTFHIDKIQGLVSKYASESFEIAVEFPERDGQAYPVIVVPGGTKTPVASKSELRDIGGKSLIGVDTVYVRSLNANNTPSTTRAIWKDWPKLMELCFDNREADIGRFLRRHLSGLTPDVLGEFARLVSKGNEPQPTNEELLLGYLREGEERFQAVVDERKVALPDHGTWEVALLIVGEVPKHSANVEFLRLLASTNPQYTGWPVWLDSRSLTDTTAHPFVANRVWEALIVELESGFYDDIDFMRLDPKGRFYLRRALPDDVSGRPMAPPPMKVLDFGLSVIRTAEAIAVGLAFAKAMGCDVATTRLAYAFRWTRLRSRQLSSWADRTRHIFPGRSAYQDDVTSFVNVPLETPLSAVGEFVGQVVHPLFEVFDGFVLGQEVVDDLTRRLIERRL